MADVHIEKNMPIPSRKSAHHARVAALPWGQMEIGDSFLFEGHSVHGMRWCAKEAGIVIDIRAVDMERTPRGGLTVRTWRIWRVE